MREGKYFCWYLETNLADLASSQVGNQCQHLIGLTEPLLLAASGTALFFDDPRGGQPFFGGYGATKAAQIALVRSWQAETAKIGPRVISFRGRIVRF